MRESDVPPDKGFQTAQAASSLIQTVIGSVVVLVVLAVGILILIHYNILG